MLIKSKEPYSLVLLPAQFPFGSREDARRTLPMQTGTCFSEEPAIQHESSSINIFIRPAQINCFDFRWLNRDIERSAGWIQASGFDREQDGSIVFLEVEPLCDSLVCSLCYSGRHAPQGRKRSRLLPPPDRKEEERCLMNIGGHTLHHHRFV
jgi:hypothetical protein